MPREDWMREDRLRTDWYGRDRRHEADDRERRAHAGPRDDYGQADYSTDYAYDPNRRSGYRAEEDIQTRRNDYGQADYSNDYAYDRQTGRAYRRFSEGDQDYGRRMDEGDYRRGEDERYDERDRGRSWRERAGAFFAGAGTGVVREDRGERDERQDERRHARRRGPSDRVLWAVIVERLEDQRGLDLRDVEVLVEDGEVTLNGTVRRKSDKRRIEDVADIEGVRNVQNNLRVRERGWF